MAVPKETRYRHGGLKNLLAGVTPVAHHDPWNDAFENEFPVSVVRRSGWCHSLGLGSARYGATRYGPEIRTSFEQTEMDVPWIIHLAEAVSEEELRSELGAWIEVRNEVAWDPQEGRVVAARGEFLGAVCLSSRAYVPNAEEMLPDAEDYRYQVANSGFEAGIMAQSFHPDTIIIDLSLGRSEALQIAANLRRDPAYETTLMIALASEAEAEPDSLKTAHSFSEAFKKPFDIALLAERIRSLAAAKRED